jgi:hypothetical protein
MVSAAIPSAPCQPGGATSTDSAIADLLRPSMNGRRLGSAVTGYAISCARAIVANVRARGLNQRAAEIAVTTAIAESTLHNYTVAVDHDSLGLFQQRPSQGWGRPGDLIDPRYATLAFLNAMIRKIPDGGWQTGDIGQICQRVQGSAFPLAYSPEEHDARLIVARLWQSGATSQTSSTKPTKSTKPAGPFQRTAMLAGTGLGPTDARHDISLADWNGDRRPDLVVVQRSGTASGRTELYILDGRPALPGTATSFQRLLLRTGTALGPTDDRSSFSVADWNGDGKPDLVVVQSSGTASGWTELRVLDGASSYQRYLLETATALGPAAPGSAFTMQDWNGDGRLDLAVIQKTGTASGHTEIRVLDGASNYQRDLLRSTTALGPIDNSHDLTVTDWNGDGKPDLVDIQRSGTKSGHTEIRVLSGAAKYQRELQDTKTALGPLDATHDLSVTDWNGDGKPDLVDIHKSGTASGRTEARILAG